LKERGAVAKDVWGVIGSACVIFFFFFFVRFLTRIGIQYCRLSVQQVMQDIERAQSKGDTSEEELKALEYDVTGKILLASWRGTRFEVVQVLREVCLDSFV
jgi:X-domain of DnaJ-containing